MFNSFVMNSVNCLNPQTIFNPACKMYLAKYRNYVSHGCEYTISDKQLYAFFCGASWKQVLPNISESDYVIDYSSGECFPFFVSVPCRKCACCLYTLASSYVQRAEFQQLQESELPLFITLTYNSSHLPSDGLLHKEHVQNFKKRLNKCFPDSTLKYMCFGEYGHEHGRPHYHLIVFGFPLSQLSSNFNCQVSLAKSYVNYCWRDTSKGFGGLSKSSYDSLHYPIFSDYNKDPDSFGHTEVLPCLDNVPIAYCCKYITKQIVSSSDRPLWHSCSQSLGLKYAFSVREYALSSFDGRFLVSHNGKTRFVGFTRYFINHLFPSFTMSISAKLRQDLKYFVGLFNNIKHLLSKQQLELTDNIFQNFADLTDFDYSISIKSSLSHQLSTFVDLLDTLLLTPIPNLPRALQLDEQRKLLLSRMLANSIISPSDYAHQKSRFYEKIIIKDAQ